MDNEATGNDKIKRFTATWVELRDNVLSKPGKGLVQAIFSIRGNRIT